MGLSGVNRFGETMLILPPQAEKRFFSSDKR